MSQPLRAQKVFAPEQEKQLSARLVARRRSFNLSRSRLPVFVIALLLGYLSISFVGQFGRLFTMQNDIRNIQQQVQELKQKNTTLREDLRLAQSDAYIEKVSREKLGLVKQGETRVVVVPPGPQLKKIQTPVQD